MAERKKFYYVNLKGGAKLKAENYNNISDDKSKALEHNKLRKNCKKREK